MRQGICGAALVVSGMLLAVGCGGTEAVDDDSLRSAESCRGAPYPIVLAHGLAGFEQVGPLQYFFGVADDLRRRGEKVVVAQVPPFELSTVRAAQLASYVDQARTQYGACKVDIIAHSQGGLDARALISSLGYGDRIAALVTISTPHRGSPIGDIVAGLVPGYADATVNALLVAYQGLTSNRQGQPNARNALTQVSVDYTTRIFNRNNPDDPRVRYYSLAGRTAGRSGGTACQGGLWGNSWRVDVTDPVFWVTEPIIAGFGGSLFNPVVNDGLVSVDSARWGTFLGCVPADHLDEVGLFADRVTNPISGFNHKEMFRKVATQLHRDGY